MMVGLTGRMLELMAGKVDATDAKCSERVSVEERRSREQVWVVGIVASSLLASKDGLAAIPCGLGSNCNKENKSKSKPNQNQTKTTLKQNPRPWPHASHLSPQRAQPQTPRKRTACMTCDAHTHTHACATCDTQTYV